MEEEGWDFVDDMFSSSSGGGFSAGLVTWIPLSYLKISICCLDFERSTIRRMDDGLVGRVW